ncbi:hypothetical protein BJX63DRAFT_426009 [Aspergillus granulosus]|uniref:F-box domain-containing protein n=1 Tax=Aspergillus granulosus TaxID=176169 RepID=A0ABR4GU09_9EURO
MVAYLPPELWTHITLYLEKDNSTLTNCARVCRQWQPMFEKLIYRNAKVESEDFKIQKGVVSLPRFRDLVSGTNQYRRSFVQRLEYTVIIPHDLSDYQTVKLAGYHDQNPKGPKFMLAPAVQGRDEALEPETEVREHVHAWEGELDGEQVVGPYRARFPGASMLPRVTCVDNLSFEWRYGLIWTGTAMQIAESSLALQRLYLNIQDLSRPDHLWYMRDRRQAVASGLARLPSTLRVLEFEGGLEHPWSNTLPALDLRPANSKIDEFSSSLRLSSCNLRELNLSSMSFNMDFLYPLDDSGSPTSDASSLHWPYLESIVLQAVPGHLPSGEWLFDYELETGDEEDFPDPATGDEIFESRWLREDYQIVRNVMNTQYFHRLFISLGYAARRMPLLKIISFDLCISPVTEFKFSSGRGGSTGSGATPSLKLESESGYTPDRRVAAAWGFSLDQLVVENPWPERNRDSVSYSVTLERLPLDD